MDWGRDTFIALRGLVKFPEFRKKAAEIILRFAAFEKNGTIPNMICGGNDSNRDTSDAPLYLIIAVRDYISEQIQNTLAQVESLRGVEWFCCDYSELTIPANSLIYCDIPYKGTKQYAISKDFDYERFYNWCRDMKSKGHIVFVSEYWMPDDFICVWEKPVKTTMNQTTTINAIEKLFKL
jgi:glycogen debranching enzyme